MAVSLRSNGGGSLDGQVRGAVDHTLGLREGRSFTEMFGK
jgi:hypothetical protein